MDYFTETVKFVQSVLFTNNHTALVFEKPSAYKNTNTSSVINIK